MSPDAPDTGSTKADLLRLNTAIAPAASPNPLGVLAGDFQRFPNGRRLADDVTDICNLSPNNAVGDGLDANENAFLAHFPYVAAPNQGYAHTGHR